MPLIEHPLRLALAHEVHARPFTPVVAPERIVHHAMLSGEGGAAADRAHLSKLMAHLGLQDVPPGATHVVRGFGSVRLKWERHTEFCTWTLFDRSAFDDPFAGPPHPAIIPTQWLDNLPGQRLAATRVVVEPAGRIARDPSVLERYFEEEFLAGSRVSGGAAAAWTDFRVHADGFGRVYVEDFGLSPRQAGRLAQRFLEIDTYRMMALLGLPVAREIGPLVTAIDGELTRITAQLRDLGPGGQERELLQTLIGLGAEIERMTSASDYRFAATRAYAALVERRIAELREERAEGLQTIAEFTDRRLAPALRTVDAMGGRLRGVAERLSRAATLLRTRVDIALEEQNQALLVSMDSRAKVQLRLQAAVEGLSLAAISYYAASLLGYLFKAAEKAGAPINADLTTGLAIPVLLLGFWLLLRRARRHLRGD
jgi:uncharacterized membrane-anchored protein